jgi:hypothetical protein
MAGSNTWYIRRKGEVKGPYPAGLVSRYILLGRLRESDQVSIDGQEWRTVSEVPDLIPKILKGDTSDPLFRERLEAARRWADERDRSRREGQSPGAQQREGGDRRSPEDAAVVEHRLARDGREQERLAEAQNRWAMLSIAGAVTVAIGLFMVFYTPPPLPTETDCSSQPRPHVNWSNCMMDGARLDDRDLAGAMLYSTSLTGANLRHSILRSANLSYAALSISNLEGADLRQATLLGANLRRARLGNALLDQADLSYADLTGADLTGASLADAKLGNAIWVDGKRCLPRSVGRCSVRAE